MNVTHAFCTRLQAVGISDDLQVPTVAERFDLSIGGRPLWQLEGKPALQVDSTDNKKRSTADCCMGQEKRKVMGRMFLRHSQDISSR